MIRRLNILFFLFMLVIWMTTIIVKPESIHFLKIFLAKETQRTEPARWNIRVKHGQMRELKSAEERAKAEGFLVRDAKTWVKANLIFENIQYPIKMRLRGDLAKHWSNPKKSYRIKFLSASPWKGYQVVDLILPEDKGEETELAAYLIGRKLNLLTPDAGFTTLAINNVQFGSYFWKQGFGSDFFELQKRPESVVFRENNIWLFAIRANGPYKNLLQEGTNDDTDLHLEPHLYSSIYSGPADGISSFGRFNKLLHSLKTGNGNIGEYLDVPKFYSWLATAVAFGSIHAVLPENVSWYLNTSTGLFEPMLYDVLPGDVDSLEQLSSRSSLIRNVLKMTWKEDGKRLLEESLSVIETQYQVSLKQAAASRSKAVTTNWDSPEIAISQRSQRLQNLVSTNLRKIRSEINSL